LRILNKAANQLKFLKTHENLNLGEFVDESQFKTSVI